MTRPADCSPVFPLWGFTIQISDWSVTPSWGDFLCKNYYCCLLYTSRHRVSDRSWCLGPLKRAKGLIVRGHIHLLSGRETHHSLITFPGVLAPWHGQYVERAIVQPTVQLATPCVVMGLPREMHQLQWMSRLNSIGHPVVFCFYCNNWFSDQLFISFFL